MNPTEIILKSIAKKKNLNFKFMNPLKSRKFKYKAAFKFRKEYVYVY